MSDGKIAIINYRSCNCASIQNMVYRLGHEAVIANDANEIGNAAGLILPGIGSFDAGMANLEQYGFADKLNALVHGDRLPILGICLGMQIMTEHSEEGSSAGLGWIKGGLKKFRPRNLPVPHMGWNVVRPVKPTPLFDPGAEDRFYFVHSYYFAADDPQDVMTVTPYGEDFASSFSRDNIFGVQFHPEKSHKFGLKMLGHFLDMVG